MRPRTELLQKSRFRTIAAANKLAADNIRLAYKFARTQESRVPLGRDEVESAAMWGLLRASRLWNPKIAKFSTFAYLCMFSELRTLLRPNKARTATRVRLNEQMPTGDREGQASDRPDAAHDVEVAMSVLDDRERFVMTERTLNRSTLEALGDLLGVTRERIRQIEIGALKKCRERLEVA